MGWAGQNDQEHHLQLVYGAGSKAMPIFFSTFRAGLGRVCPSIHEPREVIQRAELWRRGSPGRDPSKTPQVTTAQQSSCGNCPHGGSTSQGSASSRNQTTMEIIQHVSVTWVLGYFYCFIFAAAPNKLTGACITRQ